MVDDKEIGQVGTTLHGRFILGNKHLLLHDTGGDVICWLPTMYQPSYYVLNMIMYTPVGYCFLQLREKVRSTMEEIVRKALTGEEEKADHILGKPAEPTKFDCYKLAVKSFSEKCFSFSKVCENSYSFNYTYAFKFCLVLLC